MTGDVKVTQVGGCPVGTRHCVFPAYVVADTPDERRHYGRRGAARPLLGNQERAQAVAALRPDEPGIAGTGSEADGVLPS